MEFQRCSRVTYDVSPKVSTCSTHIWVLAQATLWYPAPPPPPPALSLSLFLLLSPSIYQCSCSRFSPPLSFLAQNLDRILDSRQNLATPSEVWRWRLLISAGRSLATPQYTQPPLTVREPHQWSHALDQECADKRDERFALRASSASKGEAKRGRGRTRAKRSSALWAKRSS